MPMGLLLNSFPEKINPYPERVIYVCRLKFFFHHLNWNARALGHGSAFCRRRFNFHGEIYQIRMENVSFYNDESVVLWQINPFPDYPFFALNQSGSNTNTSDKLTIWNDLSPGTLVVFSFYMLGVGHATIARELGITDRASEDRIKPVKRKIKEFFEHFDLFRVSCIYKGEIDSLLSIIREFYGVK